MANVLINETTMSSIGDAIRTKLGVQTTYLPSEMPTAILSIQGGIDADALCEETAYSIVATSASFIAENAFWASKGLQSINCPNVTTIEFRGLAECDNLSSASFPNVTTINPWAFIYDKSLTSISLPVCTSIGYGAFDMNYWQSVPVTGLQSIYCPIVQTIGNGAFRRTALTTFNAPSCTSLGEGAFLDCSSLQSVNLPLVETLQSTTGSSSATFGNCTSLTSVSIPSVRTFGYSEFYKCTSLQEISLPSATKIGGSTFYGCSSLTKVVIGTTSSSVVCTGGNNMFSNTPIASGTGYIYVADSLVTQYKQAQYWSTYSAQIKGISEIV